MPTVLFDEMYVAAVSVKLFVPRCEFDSCYRLTLNDDDEDEDDDVKKNQAQSACAESTKKGS